jgi:hypothetical protein
MHIPSTIAADHVAREVVSKEVQKIIEEDREDEIKEVREIEEVERILPEDDSKEEIKREHIDIRV